MSKVPTTATEPSTQPYPRSGVTVAIGAACGPLTSGKLTDLWATPDTDAHAFEAIYDPARISLADAETDIRAQLAEHNSHVTAFLNEDGPLTAAQRGTDWILRWGCIHGCITDHAQANASELHTAARAETALRDIDANNTPAENALVPFLAAQVVVVNDKPQAYGRATRVWLEYGTTTGELSPVEARRVLEEMRTFLPLFEAVIERAEQSAADDFEGDPEIARLDREAETRRIRAITEARG